MFTAHSGSQSKGFSLTQHTVFYNFYREVHKSYNSLSFGSKQVKILGSALMTIRLRPRTGNVVGDAKPGFLGEFEKMVDVGEGGA